MKFLLLFAVLLCPLAQAGLAKPEHPLYKPVVDEVYGQEVVTQIATEAPVTAVAVFNGTVYVGSGTGLLRLEDGKLVPAGGIDTAVSRLRTLEGTLWASAADGLWRLEGTAWKRVCEGKTADVCLWDGKPVAAVDRRLLEIAEDGSARVIGESPRPMLGVAAYAGTLYVHTAERVGMLYQGALDFQQVADWGSLAPGSAIRGVYARGSKLYTATSKGLGVLRGMTWYRITGEDGLCYEDVTCLAPGWGDDLWIGTSGGAIRYTQGEYQFFGAQRWLPNNHVNGIACSENTVYIATGGGLGVIEYQPYTLQKKADWYENWLAEWGMKRLGFVHMLVWDAANNEWIREVSDNDAGYSSHYLDALCFKYAVTQDPGVRYEAVEMMKTLKWTEEITGIPGFPARSIWAVGERGLQAQHGSGGLPAEWHATPDGQWQWKGDTSSDEIDAQIYATGLFLELVAETPEERALATEHLSRVVGHIVDQGWLLRDFDGKPTRWARWDMDYFHTEEGMAQWGLNGLEALSFATTAQHFTGEAKFAEGKNQLVAWGYPDHVLRQKLTFHPGYFCGFDDRLAFYAFFPLLRYETDPQLRALFLTSLERSWEVKRIEAVPWFNFIYGAITGNDCEEDRAVEHLRGWPLDMRLYSFSNAHRADLHTPKGYTAYNERHRPLNPRETGGRRWDSDFMELEGGAGGHAVCDPGGWLDAYWMGRYYGMITAPKTNDPALTTYPKTGRQLGAKPYTGPKRPAVLQSARP